ncbi:Hypothetical predicted protein [Pelobates cultripes]|uniref:Uncharacterized protein n=1 Tax=Pelobates cultripes TaxID=61616 RepID=A0AAD1VVY0_PELCU|nr:Hypothetical predicted protein [Pelobates cultripes]
MAAALMATGVPGLVLCRSPTLAKAACGTACQKTGPYRYGYSHSGGYLQSAV